MHLGMPVVALATTAVADAVPEAAGYVSADVDHLAAGLRELLADPDRARECGEAAKARARERFGVERFLRDWDDALEAVA
jgi:glycosyltransferase involved in cell wall biosynthesis